MHRIAHPSSSFSQVERLLAGTGEWQMDMFHLSEATRGHPLSVLGYYLFTSSGLLKELQAQPNVLAR